MIVSYFVGSRKLRNAYMSRIYVTVSRSWGPYIATSMQTF